LRRLSQDARDSSLDADVKSSLKSGSTAISLSDLVQSKIRAKDAGNSANKLKQGEKLLPAGKHEFSYNIDNLRQIIAEMEAEAKKVDGERDQAIKLSREEISDQIADLIGNAVTDKIALTMQLQYHLTNLFRTAGLPENEATFEANKRLQDYGSGVSSAQQIINAFKADKSIQQILATPQQPQDQQGQEEKPLSMAETDAVERMREILKQLPPNKINEPATQQMIYNYISEQPGDIQAAMKAEADKAFGKTQTQPAASPAAAAPQAQAPKWQQQQKEVNDLIGQQNWLKIAGHPYFLNVATPQQLTAVIGKLHQGMANPGADKEDYEFAVLHLQSLLKQKSQVQLSNIT
jgi:hypothetical protein